MTELYKRVLLIDDDLTANYINKIFLQKLLYPAVIEIISFDKPQEGLKFLISNKQYVSTILFLDINLPDINGWDFLHIMRDFSTELLDQITTYILSSSIDKEDIEKADANPLVKGFISKPLSTHIPRIFDLKTVGIENLP